MNHYGTDWRNEGTYEYTKRLSKHRWAWEFLRRSPSYRKFWNDWNANFKHFVGELKDALVRVRLADESTPMHLLPEARPLQELQDRCYSFGLTWAVDPADKHPGGAFFNRVNVQSIVVFGEVPTENKFLGKEWPGYPNHLHLEFNLALPLEPQLRAAKVDLEGHRRRAQEELGLKLVNPPKGFKLRRSQFVFYLRILDAELEGASLSDVGAVLFPAKTPDRPGDQKRSVSMAKKTALRMAEEGYWVLLLEEEEQPYLGNEVEAARKK